MKIDAHQHFWKFDPKRDSWITDDMRVLKNDFMPDDLRPLLQSEGIDGCVAVQADQSENETEFLLNLAQSHPWIKGVVGWVDLKNNNLESRLNYYGEDVRFKGVRHILQAEKSGYMLAPDFVNGVKTVGSRGLTYDILSLESQMEEVFEFVQQLPAMKLVIDHISKPNIKEQSFDQWRLWMKRISQFDHVHVKLSGMTTEANWQTWQAEDFIPYIDTCLEYFGANRLMYGSDWPVSLLAGSYTKTNNAMKSGVSRLSVDEQEQIMGLTAVQFYDLD